MICRYRTFYILYTQKWICRTSARRKNMKTLNVLYTCDENYAPFAGISMFSLFENNKDIERIRVYLVADRLTDTSLSLLSEQAKSYGRELIIVDAAEIIETIKKLNIPSYRGSYSANFRMFFHTFVDADVDRLLYLDCDTVVAGSLDSLLTLDMQSKAVGVVRDSLTTVYKTFVGFSEEDDYFNTGSIFIDVAAWKECRVTERLLDHIQNVRSRYCNPDQDLLNIVLKDDKYILPPEYNFQPSHRAFKDKTYFACYKHKKYYTSEELENARKHPVILHTYRFMGDFPWHKGNVHPDTPIFDDYTIRSPWSGYVKKPAGRGMIFAIEKLMYRLLPKRLFLKIFAAFTLRQFKKQNDEIVKSL